MRKICDKMGINRDFQMWGGTGCFWGYKTHTRGAGKTDGRWQHCLLDLVILHMIRPLPLSFEPGAVLRA